MNRHLPATVIAVLLLSTVPLSSLAGRQKNGNELALEYSTAKANRKQDISKEAVGQLYFFRYLRIDKITRGETRTGPFMAMDTVEPSSDMYVSFTVTKPVSLRTAGPLKTNDAVAVSGRLKSLDDKKNRLVLDPVIVRYKDKHAPAAGKELLPEVDPNARIGTDTSSGKEKVKYLEKTK